MAEAIVVLKFADAEQARAALSQIKTLPDLEGVVIEDPRTVEIVLAAYQVVSNS